MYVIAVSVTIFPKDDATILNKFAQHFTLRNYNCADDIVKEIKLEIC